MAIGTISVVLIAVIGSLTFLPATLAILGDGVDRLRVPFLGRDRAGGERRLGGDRPPGHAPPGHRASSRPRAPARDGRPGLGSTSASADFALVPRLDRQRPGHQPLNEKWPEGSTLTLQVVVTKADEPATQAAIER